MIRWIRVKVKFYEDGSWKGFAVGIGDRIRFFRKKKDLNQEELAQIVGVSQDAISSYERGKNDPPLATIAKIATALGVPASRLIEDPDQAQEAKYKQAEDALRRHGIPDAPEFEAGDPAQMNMVQQSIKRLLSQLEHAPDPLKVLAKLHSVATEEINKQESEAHHNLPAGSKVA